MIEKQKAIRMLEEIESSLKSNNWKQETLKTINLYIKGLTIATDEEIKKMINKYCEYTQKYGENGRKTVALGKKIDRKAQKIYNKKVL